MIAITDALRRKNPCEPPDCARKNVKGKEKRKDALQKILKAKSDSDSLFLCKEIRNGVEHPTRTAMVATIQILGELDMYATPT